MDKPVNEAQAWRVTFSARPPEGAIPRVIIREPVEAVALTDAIDISGALLGSGQNGDSLDVIWLPPTAGSSLDIEKRADTWSAAPDGPRRPPIRASLRATRVIWTWNRAVIATPADQLSDAFDAVVRFTLTERALRNVEQLTAEVWAEVDTQHGVKSVATRKSSGMRRRLADMTEKAARTRSAYMRVQSAAEQLDPTLTTSSKRLYAELADQAAVHQRLEIREDPIEFINYHCEVANYRVVESRDHTSTWIIIYLLAAQGIFDIAFLIMSR